MKNMEAMKLLWNCCLEPCEDSEQTLSFDKSTMTKNSALM